MIFIQRSAGRSYSSVQQTNNFNQRRKGNLGGQNCSNREHEYIHRPNVVKTCFTCRRYTVKSHAGEINSMLATVWRFRVLVHCLFLFRHANTEDDAMLSPFTQYWHCQQLAVQFAPPLFGCVFCVCARVFFAFLFGLFALLRLARWRLMLDKYRFLLILSFATHFHEEGCVYVVIKRISQDATYNTACWTTWRKPRGVGRKKKLNTVPQMGPSGGRIFGTACTA